MIKDYVKALFEGDEEKVRSFFAYDAYHSGFPLDEFIKYEIGQFARNSPHFDLDENFNYEMRYVDGTTGYYSFFNSKNQFVFGYLLNIENGKIIPDGSRFQLVPKILFKNGSAERSIAFASPYHKFNVLSITPKKLELETSKLSKSINEEGDGFSNYLFSVHNDDYQGVRFVDFRVLANDYSETVKTILSGTDHMDFIEDMYPIISEDRLSVAMPDNNAFIWSLAIEFKNGENFHLEFPKGDIVYTDKEIEKVILTDALDNDWSVEVSQ